MKNIMRKLNLPGVLALLSVPLWLIFLLGASWQGDNLVMISGGKLCLDGATCSNKCSSGGSSITCTSTGGNQWVMTSADLSTAGTFSPTGSIKAGGANNKPTCNLNGASPSTCTATIDSGAKCACSNATTAANAVKCSESGTTATVTGPNAATDTIQLICF